MRTLRGKLRFLVALGIAALVTALSAAGARAVTPAQIKQTGVVKVVITSSSPPHGFLDAKTNSLKGIMFEVAQAIAADMGVTLRGRLIAQLTPKFRKE